MEVEDDVNKTLTEDKSEDEGEDTLKAVDSKFNCVSYIFFEGHRFLTSVNEHTILDYTVFVVNQKFRFGKKAAGTRVPPVRKVFQ